MGVLRVLTLAAALAVPAAAAAHVSVQPTAAAPGAYQVLRFGVGHGCDGRATTALRISIPSGVEAARPQPKPGWKLVVERDGGGKPDAVAAIRWQGSLPADQFEEFVMLVKLPRTAGPLAFPAVQTCGKAETGWTDVSPPGGPRPAHPAPTVILGPAAPADARSEHQH